MTYVRNDTCAFSVQLCHISLKVLSRQVGARRELSNKSVKLAI